MLYKLFLICFFSSIAYANGPKDRVLNALNSVHAIQWDDLVKSGISKKQIEEELRKISNIDKDFKSIQSTRETYQSFEVQMKALKEYGKFATNDEGKLSVEAKKHYETMVKKFSNVNDHNLAKDKFLNAYSISLTNVNTPEAVILLLPLIDYGDSSIQSAALRGIEEMYHQTDIETFDSKMIDAEAVFMPNKQEVLAKDRKDFHDWNLAAKEVQEKIQSTLIDIQDVNLQRQIEITTEVMWKSLEGQKISRHDPLGDGTRYINEGIVLKDESFGPPNNEEFKSIDNKDNVVEFKDNKSNAAKRDIAKLSLINVDSQNYPVYYYLLILLTIILIIFLYSKFKK